MVNYIKENDKENIFNSLFIQMDEFLQDTQNLILKEKFLNALKNRCSDDFKENVTLNELSIPEIFLYDETSDITLPHDITIPVIDFYKFIMIVLEFKEKKIVPPLTNQTANAILNIINYFPDINAYIDEHDKEEVIDSPLIDVRLFLKNDKSKSDFIDAITQYGYENNRNPEFHKNRFTFNGVFPKKNDFSDVSNRVFSEHNLDAFLNIFLKFKKSTVDIVLSQYHSEDVKIINYMNAIWGTYIQYIQNRDLYLTNTDLLEKISKISNIMGYLDEKLKNSNISFKILATLILIAWQFQKSSDDALFIPLLREIAENLKDIIENIDIYKTDIANFLEVYDTEEILHYPVKWLMLKLSKFKFKKALLDFIEECSCNEQNFSNFSQKTNAYSLYACNTFFKIFLIFYQLEDALSLQNLNLSLSLSPDTANIFLALFNNWNNYQGSIKEFLKEYEKEGILYYPLIWLEDDFSDGEFLTAKENVLNLIQKYSSKEPNKFVSFTPPEVHFTEKGFFEFLSQQKISHSKDIETLPLNDNNNNADIINYLSKLKNLLSDLLFEKNTELYVLQNSLSNRLLEIIQFLSKNTLDEEMFNIVLSMEEDMPKKTEETLDNTQLLNNIKNSIELLENMLGTNLTNSMEIEIVTKPESSSNPLSFSTYPGTLFSPSQNSLPSVTLPENKNNNLLTP